MDENKDLTELTEEESPASDDLLYLVVDADATPAPRKVTVGTLLGTVSDSGKFGAAVDKTIALGIVTLTDEEHFVALTGQAGTDDELTDINKTGGGYLDNGHVVVLTGAAGLDHVITLVDGGKFKLQGVFSINNEYDSITLIKRGDSAWQEVARANCS
jgi:hypothetical protein